MSNRGCAHRFILFKLSLDFYFFFCRFIIIIFNGEVALIFDCRVRRTWRKSFVFLNRFPDFPPFHSVWLYWRRKCLAYLCRHEIKDCLLNISRRLQRDSGRCTSWLCKPRKKKKKKNALVSVPVTSSWREKRRQGTSLERDFRSFLLYTFWSTVASPRERERSKCW